MIVKDKAIYCKVLVVLLLSLALPAMAADATFDTVTAKHLIVKGSKTKAVTIVPTAANEYAPVAWKDQQGNIVAMIVAHELQTNGAVHNHLSIYTADKDRTKRVSRIDVQFGVDDPIISFEKINVMLKDSAKLLLKDTKDGKVYQVYLENGVVKTKVTAYTTNLIPD